MAERGAIPVILLNLRSPRVQRPGTCQAILAHELCHVLHDGNRRHNPVTSVSFAHEEGGEPSDQERRANGFAPAFLAPARFLDLSAGPEPLAVHLVETWGFSMEGAAWHTKNLLNLSTQEKQLILRHLQSRGWREALVAPPEPAWRISSGLVAELAREAQRQELISEGRLQEILEMS